MARSRRKSRHMNPFSGMVIKLNPTPMTWAIGGVIAAVTLGLGAAATAAIRRKKKKGGGTLPPAIDPNEPPPPKPDPQKKNYVGSGYNWPNKGRFPNEQSFIMLLNKLGYPANINKSITSDTNMIAVRAFQRDFNKVRSIMENPPGQLDQDGLIGKNTINAFILTESLESAFAMAWPAIVQSAGG